MNSRPIILSLLLPAMLHAASDVTVSTAATSGGTFSGANPNVFTPVNAAAFVQASAIQTQLNAGTGVTLDTASAAAGNGDITWSTAVTKNTGANTAAMVFNATRDISFSNTLTASAGQIPLTLNAGRRISTTSSGSITTNGGAVILSPVEEMSLGAKLDAGAGAVTLQSGLLRSSLSNLTITTSSLTITSGASLRTAGTIAGPMNVAGSISPGAPGATGALQVNGALALQGGSTTHIEISGTANSAIDKITSNNAVTIAGALQVELVSNYHDTIASGTTYTILQGTSISGTFTGLPNGSRYTLANDRGSFRINYTGTTVTLDDWQPVTTTLAWDPGTAEAGTAIFSNTNTRAGRHLFKITTQSGDTGGWRTRLTVTSGEAALYFSKTALPTTASSTHSSIQTGSDGLVLRDDQFAVNEEWNLMVYATEGAQWSLVSGKPYVHDLGALPFTDANGNGSYDIGEAVAPQNAPATPMPPEGIRFYRAVIPNGTPAWSLWLGGSNKDIAVRSNKLPFHNTTTHYTKKQANRMLMVPPVLGAGSSTWYASVMATQGEEIGLDSRIQFVSDLAYNGTISNVAVNGPLYRVYRVQVPVDQIAWDINATALAGNPDIAVRKGSVPAEFDNEAFSATPGNATEGITLVPNYLTDGTWYITTWSDAPYSFTMKNGDPVITPLSFTDLKVNDQPTRSGWRFYALTDIPSQVGALGWELELSNQVAGTQLALRRNKVPGRWQKRSDGTLSDTNATYMDESSTNGFIQRMNHQADVWYVGVFLPQQALGAFTLDVHPITPSAISFRSSTAVTAIPPQKWRYYRMDIGSGMQGWDLRLSDSTGGNCTMVVRRDQLPQSTGTTNGGTSPWSASADPAWPSGYQWEAGKDWTGRTYDVTTSPRREMNDRIVAAAGRPLVPGTYYIGIRNDSTNASGQLASTILESRGIGAGLDIPIGTMGFPAGSSVAISNLTAREAAYYKVSIPENTTSWEFTLDQSVGESALVMRRGTIPDFNAAYNGDVQNLSNTATRQVKMQSPGSERYLMLPSNNEAAITPGDYYIGVFSEGLNPPNSDVIGTGPSSATLTSRGPLAIQNLGTASAAGIVQPVSVTALQVKAYQFTVPTGAAALEVRLENKVGSPLVALISGARIPQPDGGLQDYGVAGGQTTGATGGMNRDTLTGLTTYPNPAPGVYTLTVRADEVSGSFPDASANLVITANAPVPLAFNGTDSVTNHPATAWRYFQVTVPDGIMAWDIRLTNITSGNPQMVIRRDQTPSSFGTNNGGSSPWSPSSESVWPSGYQWAGGNDWTGRGFNLPGGSQRPVGNRLFAAMGRPLVAGTYIVGILNQGTDPVTGVGSTPANYGIESRGVGIGQPVTVGEIPFAVGSSMAVNALPRREAAFFKITVPANTPRWEFNLSPTVGEAMMILRRGFLPDFNAAETGNVQDTSGGRAVRIQRAGMERYLLLPENNQDSIVAGDYYLAVIAEGVDPPSSAVVGTGSSSATFTIQQPLTVADLGTVSTSGITQAVSLAAAEVKAFQFTVPAGTVSMEIGLENKAGNPTMAFISGTRIPQPDNALHDYGVSSGQTAAPAGGGMSRQYGTGLQTFTSPPPGVYTATVRADDSVNAASANFVIRANAPQDLPLGGGSTLVTNHGPNSWRYFRVEVPAGIAGWDLRLKDITGGDVSWAIRRDQIPANTGTNTGGSTPWTPSSSATWPSGNQWGGGKDWTDRLYDTAVTPRRDVNDRLVMAMGRPLEPGTYFIGVQNSGTDPMGGGSSQMSSYTIESRFIGAGQAIPIGTLGFAAGSSVAVNNLVPREANYYKVSIPDNTPSWEFTFGPTAGEMLVVARHGYIPDFNAGTGGNLQDPANSRQIKVQKAGAERYLLLPPDEQNKIVAGDYYLAVVSEGVNPTGTSVIGSGTSSGTLASSGSPAVTQLGTASLSPIHHAVSLAGAQVKGYQFTVPEGVASLELQLNNRTGEPRMALISGNRLPFPDTNVNEFGTGGGQSSAPVGGVARSIANSLITVPNPPAGTYSLTIRADDVSSAYPDATADLVVVARPRTAMNFASSQNGNGLSHADTRQLANGQKQFYEVAVPATLGSRPVLGWMLKVNHAQGDTTLQVYKQWGNPDSGVKITGNTALIVPPFLTFDETWFIEVAATGLTNYTLTSQPVTLERPAWEMPAGHNFTFGDSGNDSSGNPLPGDRGTDIGQDDWHIYAIDVPANNSGLLRTELRAISGNPNLYIREDGVPTTDHDGNGGALGGENLVHRKMEDTGSEYGNWVPFDGRTERALRPGRWYLGVKASGGSNARYRLMASTGQVSDLDLASASVSNQTLIGRDWRYYRFTVPADAPATWSLGFTQQVGDVVMWIRDTVPSGQNSLTGTSNIESWSADNKNQGPYDSAGHDAPAIYPFNTPPLRPGHTYYAGFRATSDATFSVTSSTSGSIPAITSLAFSKGAIDTTVGASGSVFYKIEAPSDATRLKWTSTHPATVQIRVEQGTLPGLTGGQSSNSSGANSTLNQGLTPTGWPWQPGQTYYLRIVNNGTAPANVLLNTSGVNAGTEDEDGDGLLDAWERTYFPSHLTYNGTHDPDGDGVINSVEFEDKTIPNDINSAKYFLTVNANFGTVAKSPDLPKYPRGTNVTLTATPNAGLIFTGWSVDATGTSNPLQFAITADKKNVIANFGVSLPVALDTGLSFNSGGDSQWMGQVVTSLDGVDAAQSAPIGHNQQTWMETTVNGPGEMSFWWKVSSQSGDYLEFHVDGVLRAGRITGEVDWAAKSYAIDPGQHVLRWRYVKNGSGTAGSDCAWVDSVQWIPSGSYGQWVSDHFTEQETGDPAIVGQEADPDRDGLANVLEYAFGTDPREGDSDRDLARVTPEVVQVVGEKRLRLRFTLPEYIPVDVLYQIEVSNGLGEWTVVAEQSGSAGWSGAANAVIGRPANGRCEHVITSSTSAPRFGRIRVTLP